MNKSMLVGSRFGLPHAKMVEKPRVCKNLFGTVKAEDLRKDLDEQLAQASKHCRTRWNYDCENDMPLEGRYEWCLSDSKEYVPECYKKVYSSRKTLTAVRNRVSMKTDIVTLEAASVPYVWSLAAVSTPQTPDNTERISQEEQETTPENIKQTPCERKPRLVQRRINEVLPVIKRGRDEEEETIERKNKARRLEL